jgi:mercuric ion transport protein
MNMHGYRSARLPTNTIEASSADVDRFIKLEPMEPEKQGRALIRTGLVGAGLAAVCCFTLLLVVVLPAVALGAWLAEVDWVLSPLLLVSLGVMAFGLIRWRARTDACCETQITKTRV